MGSFYASGKLRRRFFSTFSVPTLNWRGHRRLKSAHHQMPPVSGKALAAGDETGVSPAQTRG
jgi:hypothetical protein